MPNRFEGKQGRGSRRADRIAKRLEAEARNKLTNPKRRKSARKGKVSA